LLQAKAPAPPVGIAGALGGLYITVFAARFAQWDFVI
jgi:hypothetical protein